MDNEHFPHVGVGCNQAELYARDIFFINYHINHDKWNLIRHSDIIDAHRFAEDFRCDELSSCWVITTTEEGSGSATETCIDVVNGVLRLTNAGGDNDADELAQDCECWQLVDSYPLYAEIRFRISDALQSDFWFGLITGTTFFTPPNDYVIFKKDDGDYNLDVANALNGAGNDTDTGLDLVADTWYRLGIHWDGAGNLRFMVFADGDAPQTCLYNGVVTTHIVQDEALALGFGIRNGEADAKYLDVDYIKCVQKRVIN